jgi:type IV pilus assembly protein PilV
MITNTSDSIFRAQANYLAQQKIGEMWANPGNILTYVTTTSTQDLPNGQITVTAPAPPAPPNLYKIDIQWQQPGQTQHTFTTFATIIAPFP